METAPLKSFATWARTALIREVNARIAAVLAPASKERVESASAVAALERDIAAEGGGETGRDAIADKAAYTWFNRIIALRFMDANGFTGIGIVSPPRGQATGQPEVLADAKRGDIDPAAVTNKRAIEAITALLDGTRRSDDAQGEVYALLLAEYCRHWNRSMPFMFEREGDYTELLIPANLLADDSVLARAVTVLTEDVCQDVEVIGWLYQFYISERKDEVFAGFKTSKKAGAAEIPAATQLFTPHWIVRYLVENSLGRLWLLNRPASSLVEQMDYYIEPVDKEPEFLRLSSPEDLKIIDPACGSGHMLTYAFDLLHAIYEEEGYAPADIPGLILAKNLYGTEIDPRAGALAAFALSMKARARQRTFFTKRVEPNVCVIKSIAFEPTELDIIVADGSPRTDGEAFWNQFQDAEVLGSLIRPVPYPAVGIPAFLTSTEPRSGDLLEQEVATRARRVLLQAEYLSQRYSVVVANPPYMGAKNLNSKITGWLGKNYPDGKADLFAASFYRYFDLVVEMGQLGLMSPFVWMFISTYKALRKYFIDEQTLTSLVQLEYSGFEGATVPVCAFTIQKGRREFKAAYVRLTDFVGASQQGPRCVAVIRSATDEARSRPNTRPEMAKHLYRVSADELRGIPGSPIVYWLAAKLAPVFESHRSIGDIAYTRIGLITGDNANYLREWHEVSLPDIGVDLTREAAATSGRKWFPVSKGGEYRKWYGNVTSVVNWHRDGEELQTRLDSSGSRVLAHNFNLDDIFREGVTWSKISSSRFGGRYQPSGYLFNDPSASIFPLSDGVTVLELLGYLASTSSNFLLQALNPTLNFQPGNVSTLPWPSSSSIKSISAIARAALAIAEADWNEFETSRNFSVNALARKAAGSSRLSEIASAVEHDWDERTSQLLELEQENNWVFAEALGLSEIAPQIVTRDEITLDGNADWSYGHINDPVDRRAARQSRLLSDFVSYAVGCMFGRYSLDEPGPILANQGATLEEYLAKVPIPTFLPDKDNVIPIVDGDWFEDDIVARFRQFLRATFGEEHFEENLRFVTESLGVKDLRDYFVKSFYKDHVQRNKKRPIYWLFSSPKGSFNALIYMHRYTPSTVSTVLNEYLREFKAKLEASRQHHVRLAASDGTPRGKAAAEKEVDWLRRVLLELDGYEHDVLYPLATQQLAIDLDDGVKANYPKFADALKKIPGLEANDE